MIFANSYPQKRRKATEGNRKISVMVLTASVRSATGFTSCPLDTRIFYGPNRSFNHRPLPLKFADTDSIDSGVSGSDDPSSPSKTHFPLVTDPAHNTRSKSKQHRRHKDDIVNNELSALNSNPTDISDAIQEVLNSPVIPSEEKKHDRKKLQRLILPISISKRIKFGDVKSTNTVAPESITLESESIATKKVRRSSNKISITKRWHRLRPGQKFRFRLGIMSIAFVTLWNTIAVRNYSGFITGIITGAATTTTATGFGSTLRRWFSNRGFQGIAALGRSIAYGWAILVAYPRMLDRRKKERKLKREDQALDQWRYYLKGTSDEVVRLRKELSLLEGEIRAFRREILSIRAMRIDNDAASPKNKSGDGLDDIDSSDESDRMLREAIINEMTHLTRLRDDTRLALNTAQIRWLDVRAKRPSSHSQSALMSTFDPLEFELNAVIDLKESDMESGNGDNDPLLNGF